MSYPLLWLRAFAITLFIEEAIAVPLLKPIEPSVMRRIGMVLVANVATHPLVWFFFPHLGWSWGTVVVVAEAWAVGFEVLVYALMSKMTKSAPLSRCIAASALANAGSYLVGMIASRW